LHRFDDTLVCENQEGDTPRYGFSKEQWFFVPMSQKYSLTMRMTHDVRKLYISKLFRYPLQKMQDALDAIVAGT